MLAKVEAELRLLQVIPAQAIAPALPIKDIDGPWVIACALMSNVNCFVTGDAELLRLGMVYKLPIISPRVCWSDWSYLT